jgi:hypothetical protein
MHQSIAKNPDDLTFLVANSQGSVGQACVCGLHTHIDEMTGPSSGHLPLAKEVKIK